MNLKRTLKDNGIAWFLTPNEGEEERNETDVFYKQIRRFGKLFSKKIILRYQNLVLMK